MMDKLNLKSKPSASVFNLHPLEWISGMDISGYKKKSDCRLTEKDPTFHMIRLVFS